MCGRGGGGGHGISWGVATHGSHVVLHPRFSFFYAKECTSQTQREVIVRVVALANKSFTKFEKEHKSRNPQMFSAMACVPVAYHSGTAVYGVRYCSTGMVLSGNSNITHQSVGTPKHIKTRARRNKNSIPSPSH
jgi:hypothetical protein